VFLVLSSQGAKRRRIEVRLDGRRIALSEAGSDIKGSVLNVQRQRLYRLVDLPRVEERLLELRLSRGIAAYAFTFG
jgi:hypothetical protein